MRERSLITRRYHSQLLSANGPERGVKGETLSLKELQRWHCNRFMIASWYAVPKAKRKPLVG